MVAVTTPGEHAVEPSSTSGSMVITIGPRRFDTRRDTAVVAGFTVALAVVILVAARAGLPGWIGIVYITMAFAVWVQEFRRSWRISADRVEARRWFRWQAVDRGDIATVTAARDEMGIRAVSLATAGGVLEIPSDDVRVEPLLAAALAGFLDACVVDGAEIDPAVAPLVAS